MLLSDCAKRNGVATGALDVGLDQSGALAAANGPAIELTPLPLTSSPPASASAIAPDGNTAPPSADGETATSDFAACWRRAPGVWRKMPIAMTLDACVQTLYGGRCLPPASAPVYGRWGDQTLRLVPGEVDISDDNRDFRPVAEQAPDCSLPPISSPR